jgi:TetR/AcrR family transcriptional regulator, transcriptional repressor of bet genes
VTERARRPPADKFEERRVQLAHSALETLGELGYARTSLREVAQRSAFTHGLLHYYFADRTELITYAVRLHKTTCVRRYDDVVAAARTPEELVDGFTARLTQTVREDARLHLLWYDVRTQAMFEPALREMVLTVDGWLRDMVWRVVSRYAELCERPAALDPGTAYGMVDGLFQRALYGHVVGTPSALPELVAQVRGLLPAAVAGAPEPVR